ncbi:MAG: hypothetical protein IPH57_11530 [Saprospiraceae bacterium]|nr:hypothetical protein [Saprospiraceae bacterium]
MKKLFHILLIPLLILFSSYQVLHSQITTQEKSKTYFTWVKYMDNSYSEAVYLKEVKDSSIIIMEKKDFKNKTIMINDIEFLRFRKKNNDSKGFLYRALVGFALGAIIGPLGEDDLPIPLLAMAGGIALALPGTMIGGMIGSATIKIKINGNQNNYNAKKKNWKSISTERITTG